MAKDYYTITIFKYEHFYQPYKWIIEKNSNSYFIGNDWAWTKKTASRNAKRYLKKRLNRNVATEVDRFIING